LTLLGDVHGTSIIGAVGKLGDSIDSTALGMTTLRLLAAVAITYVAFTHVEEADEVRVSKLSIGLLGVLVLVSDDGLSGSWSGVSLVFVACVSWSFGSALSRRIDMPDGPMTTALEMASAAGGFIVLSLVTGESIDAPSLRSGLAVGYLVVFGSIVAFSAFTYLIGNVSGPLAMSYAYINPAIAVLLGVVFSDETVSVNMAIALPVILVGVAIVTNASRPPDTTTVEDASTVRP
ncbi:MAG: hypothetical protein EBZ93_02795, partial [Actinobacteria bacterium]|nr:hypothetical protein [Actinomycetota bacterium]